MIRKAPNAKVISYENQLINWKKKLIKNVLMRISTILRLSQLDANQTKGPNCRIQSLKCQWRSSFLSSWSLAMLKTVFISIKQGTSQILMVMGKRKRSSSAMWVLSNWSSLKSANRPRWIGQLMVAARHRNNSRTWRWSDKRAQSSWIKKGEGNRRPLPCNLIRWSVVLQEGSNTVIIRRERWYFVKPMERLPKSLRKTSRRTSEEPIKTYFVHRQASSYSSWMTRL